MSFAYSGDVQRTATGRGGAGSGGHDCKNHEGCGVRLIGLPERGGSRFSLEAGRAEND